MVKSLFICLIINICSVTTDKNYCKVFYQNGQLKSEGWVRNNQKTGYWFYYNADGVKLEEGHYKNDKKIKWWILYNDNAEIIKKSEFKNNVQNGYSIVYKKGNPIRGEMFVNGVKTKEWHSLSEFKADNFISGIL